MRRKVFGTILSGISHTQNYSLAELREVTSYVKKRHGDKNDGTKADTFEAMKFKATTNKPKATFSATIIPIGYQQQLARTPAHEIEEGSRNAWLFSNVSLKFCRVVAHKYREANDFDGFMFDARLKAEQLNAQLTSAPQIISQRK